MHACRSTLEDPTLDRLLGASVRRRTWPSFLPLLRLDRIWLRPTAALTAPDTVRDPLARIASDHLPLTAEIAVPTLRQRPGIASRPAAL